MLQAMVFIQSGDDGGPFNHLNYAALQARWWNPHLPVIVIGDEKCRASLVVPGLELVALEEFSESGADLRLIYRHLCTNAPDYELFCMTRWFVLRDYMTMHSITRALHLDTDVMVYADMAEQDQRFQEPDLTLCRRSGHCSFIALPAVEKLCAYMIACYSTPEGLAKLEHRYSRFQSAGLPGGVSDMTMISGLSESGGLRVVQTDHPALAEPPFFDPIINNPESFQPDADGRKAVEFIAGQPHAQLQADGTQARFATLHFQYLAKRVMARYLQPPGGAGLEAEVIRGMAGRFEALRGAHSEKENSTREALAAHQELLSEALRRAKAAEKAQSRAQDQQRAEARRIVQELEALAASQWLRRGAKMGFTRADVLLRKLIERVRKLDESTADGSQG
jgi:hypothetical protein